MFSFGVYIFTFLHFYIFYINRYMRHVKIVNIVVDLDENSWEKNYTGGLAQVPHTWCAHAACVRLGDFWFFFLSVAKQDGNVWSFCPADSGPGDRDADRQTTKDWCPDSDLVISGLMGAHDRFPAFFCSFLCKHLRMFLCLPGLEQIENSSDFHVRNYQTKCATLKLNAIRLTTWNADICMCRH